MSLFFLLPLSYLLEICRTFASLKVPSGHHHPPPTATFQSKRGDKDEDDDDGGGGGAAPRPLSVADGAPLRLRRLFSLFSHLCTDGGRSDVFAEMGCADGEDVYDVFIVATRLEKKEGFFVCVNLYMGNLVHFEFLHVNFSALFFFKYKITIWNFYVEFSTAGI